MKMREILFFMIMLLAFSCCIAEDNVISESGNSSCDRDADGACLLNQTIEATENTTILTTVPSIMPTTSSLNNVVDRIEVYHFHGNSQCYSCKTVGAYAEETVNTYFAEELNSGKLVFAHINFDLPENKELAERYGVTGSSLWIGTYKGGAFTPEQNVNVWYKISNKEDYMNYLKGVIEEKLLKIQ
jgi:hypothetical protein